MTWSISVSFIWPGICVKNTQKYQTDAQGVTLIISLLSSLELKYVLSNASHHGKQDYTALFETTASALEFALGSVLWSEVLSAYAKHAQLSKQPRGQLASPELNLEPKPWIRKGPILQEACLFTAKTEVFILTHGCCLILDIEKRINICTIWWSQNNTNSCQTNYIDNTLTPYDFNFDHLFGIYMWQPTVSILTPSYCSGATGLRYCRTMQQIAQSVSTNISQGIHTKCVHSMWQIKYQSKP